MRILLTAAWILLAACSALPRRSADHRLVDGRTGETVAPGTLADRLATADVVFLGEIHNNDIAHRLQVETFERLVARRPDLVLTLEMFERDVQGAVDGYLSGRTDEASFLEASRPWKTYARHYRPLIELARRHGIPVVAANLPRETATRIARQGLEAGADDPYMPRDVWLGSDGYRARFTAAMEGHVGVDELDFYFAAQVAKDAAMAESIAALGDVALVVHVCGRFHSDYRLGTVERLVRLAPDLDVQIISTVESQRVDGALAQQECERADWIWLVRPTKVP